VHLQEIERKAAARVAERTAARNAEQQDDRRVDRERAGMRGEVIRLAVALRTRHTLGCARDQLFFK
jgi:hypothetical protein